ncbi:MAG TPA: hypothetical protein VGR20_19520 [Acidimicrobiia bacterium]|nr:hypothetical protein [Acidimicrobiia bacterium]
MVNSGETGADRDLAAGFGAIYFAECCDLYLPLTAAALWKSPATGRPGAAARWIAIS